MTMADAVWPEETPMRRAAFQRRDALFQHISGRVHDAGVNIAQFRQRKQAGRVVRVSLN
jgi:hypothetical protein